MTRLLLGIVNIHSMLEKRGRCRFFPHMAHARRKFRGREFSTLEMKSQLWEGSQEVTEPGSQEFGVKVSRVEQE